MKKRILHFILFTVIYLGTQYGLHVGLGIQMETLTAWNWIINFLGLATILFRKGIGYKTNKNSLNHYNEEIDYDGKYTIHITHYINIDDYDEFKQYSNDLYVHIMNENSFSIGHSTVYLNILYYNSDETRTKVLPSNYELLTEYQSRRLDVMTDNFILGIGNFHKEYLLKNKNNIHKFKRGLIFRPLFL